MAGKFFCRCVTNLTLPRNSRCYAARDHRIPFAGVAMAVRKGVFRRWSEEAEARHVRERAALEQRLGIPPSRPAITGTRRGLLSRLRILLRRIGLQIMRDG